MLIHVIVFICNTRRHNLKFSFNVTWFWIICLFVWVLDHCTCVWLVWHFILGKRSLVCIAATASCGHSLCMEVRWCGFLMAWGIDRFRIRWYLGVVWLSSVQCYGYLTVCLSEHDCAKEFYESVFSQQHRPLRNFCFKVLDEFCGILFIKTVSCICCLWYQRCEMYCEKCEWMQWCGVSNVNDWDNVLWEMWMIVFMWCKKCEWLWWCGVRNVNDCDDMVWEMWLVVMMCCEKCDWLDGVRDVWL